MKQYTEAMRAFAGYLPFAQLMKMEMIGLTENSWKVRSAKLALNKEDWNARLQYLMLLDGNATSPRHMSNRFYKSREWMRVRDEVIERDLGCDLGIYSLPIEGPIIVHHINPLCEDGYRELECRETL